MNIHINEIQMQNEYEIDLMTTYVHYDMVIMFLEPIRH